MIIESGAGAWGYLLHLFLPFASGSSLVNFPSVATSEERYQGENEQQTCNPSHDPSCYSADVVSVASQGLCVRRGHR